MADIETLAHPLTRNDRRVLAAIKRAQAEYDGFAPHGPADWIGVRRLLAAGLVKANGFGVCCDCDTEAHILEPTEGPIFVLTAEGGARDDGGGGHG